LATSCSHQRMNSIIAGKEYVAALTARDSDRRARAAFQRLALSLVGPGRRIFDFGCGPGLDAAEYARQGAQVDAFDIDERMCEYCREYCREPLARGQMRITCCSYPEFLAARSASVSDLVTANFAPLNLANDLPRLFAKFHALTSPQGRILASVLNPWYLGDARYGWWWRHRARLIRQQEFALPGAQATIVRRTPRRFGQLAAAYFAPPRVHAIDGTAPADWSARARSKFLFLVFEKRTDVSQ
jgi:SAM-dependent methyltransferase